MKLETALPYIIAIALPILVAYIAYFFFKTHTDNEEGRRRYLLHSESQKHMLPLRLQAYERITLFLERMSPHSLLLRVKPTNTNVDAYENDLIRNIDQEFEHNLTQQIYLSNECWNVVQTSKNATIQTIRKIAMSEKVDTAQKLREQLLNHFMGEQTPSRKALAYVKQEVTDLF